MKFAKKSTTAASLTKSLVNLGAGERIIYGTGKLPAVEYHKVGKTMSSHTLKDFIDPSISDHHFMRKHIKRDLEQKDSPAFLLGRAFHTKVLEPELFSSEYAVMPEIETRTSKGKLTMDTFNRLNKNKDILTAQQAEQINKMAEAINGNRFAVELLKDTHKEASGFYRHESGVILRGRADAVSYGNYVIDVKTVDDVSPKGFAKAAANFRYDIQEWFYKNIFDAKDFIFICVSKAEPFEVGIYRLNDEFQAKAVEQIPPALERWKDLCAAARWDSYTTDEAPLIDVAPPSWFNYL